MIEKNKATKDEPESTHEPKGKPGRPRSRSVQPGQASSSSGPVPVAKAAAKATAKARSQSRPRLGKIDQSTDMTVWKKEKRDYFMVSC